MGRRPTLTPLHTPSVPTPGRPAAPPPTVPPPAAPPPAPLAVRPVSPTRAAPQPGPRGLRGPGRGRVSYIEAPPEWRGTTVQVCGLFPFTVGGGSPTIGVPLGRNLLTGATVCCDPLAWFQRARLILNPSMFLLGLPALGKSTLVRRMVIGLAGAGTVPLILGDLKPDYVDTVRALGGQVIGLGRGLGALNVLDAGALDDAADQLATAGLTSDATSLREEAHGRRTSLVEALITLVRGSRPTDTERTVLSAALRVLADRHQVARAFDPAAAAPLLTDLAAVLEQAPEPVRVPTLDRGDLTAYRAAVDPLHRSLLSLLDGPLGTVFARPTTTRLAMDATAVCVDVSGISAGDTSLQAAVLLACWSEGFGAVEAANALADAGLAPQRRFFIVLDELWRVLRSGDGMVDKVDELTRLNRNSGVGQAMITHSMTDLRALRNPEDRAKAQGFIERAGLLVVGGLPAQEVAELSQIVAFSRAERRQVTSWSTPPGWDAASLPPGVGKFLLKSGQRPGIPVHVDLTRAELDAAVHDTNKRWNTRAAHSTAVDVATPAMLTRPASPLPPASLSPLSRREPTEARRTGSPAGRGR